MKQKLEKFEFKSDFWFDIMVEAEDYEKAKYIYNQFIKKEFKI